MSEPDFNIIRDAVNIARNERTPTVEALRSRLKDAGHDEQEIHDSLMFWGNQLPDDPRSTAALS